MVTVKYTGIESATVRVSNEGSDGATYGMSCLANISAQTVNNIYGGQVTKDGQHVANFDHSGGTNMSISFFNVGGDEYPTILSAVQEYIEAVRAYVSENPVMSN